MNTEQLAKAKEIERNISELKKHKEAFEKAKKNIEKATIRLRFDGDTEDFIQGFLPINKVDFMYLYLNKVDQRISELELDFSRL